jgi:hypothetical protein
LGEGPAPTFVSMICSPDGVVTGFGVCARVGVAIAAPPEMTASLNTAERREHCGIVLPPLERATLTHDFEKHDSEKACPGLDPGWYATLGKDHAQIKAGVGWDPKKMGIEE